MEKQDRPTKRIGVRDCEEAEKLVLHASDHNYYNLSRNIAFFTKILSNPWLLYLCLDMAHHEI